MNTAPNRHALRGSLDALPLFIPALPFAFVFGVVVAEAGIPEWLGWSSSPIIFGGAIQVTLFTLIGEGASVAAAVSAALIVGARHMLYSVTLAPRFQNQPGWFRWVGAYVLIDQVFVLSQIKRIDDPVAFRRYFLSAGFTFWTLWMISTALGVVLGPAIPTEWGVEFAAPVLFVSLMMAASGRQDKLAAAAMAMGVTYLLASWPNRAGILIAVIVSVCVMLLATREAIDMIATAIILTGIGSYAMRAFFIFALARYAFPPLLLRALEYVAPTVMAALVISMLTTPEGELAAGPPEIVGLVCAAFAARTTDNHIFALIAGMGTFWLIGAII